MSDLFETLTEQHRNTLKLIRIIEKQIDRVEDGESPDLNLMADIMQYLTRYVDTAHHPLEEALIDLYLESVEEPSAAVLSCREQHGVLAELGREFNAIIEGVREEQLVERKLFTRVGRAFIEKQIEHMDLEEGSVFRSLKDTLAREQLEQAVASVARGRDPLFDTIVESEYSKLYSYILRSA